MTPSTAPLAPKDRAVILILLMSTFVVILNETIMNVALPRLMTDLKITAGTAHSVGGSPAESRRGLDLLPRTYRITVEDKRRGVDLVPLHRALRGLDGMRDMSLLSYSNGVAMVALETVGPVSPEALAEAVSRAMAREAIVEVHNEQTMVVKLVEN